MKINDFFETLFQTALSEKLAIELPCTKFHQMFENSEIKNFFNSVLNYFHKTRHS